MTARECITSLCFAAVTGKVYSASSAGKYAWFLVLLALALLIVVVVAVYYRRKYRKEAGDVHPQVM